MTDSNLRVIARGNALPNGIGRIRAVLEPLVTDMQNHEYCERYEVWVSSRSSTEFVIYQEWSDEEALKAHLQSARVQEVGYALGELVTGPPEVRHYRRLL